MYLKGKIKLIIVEITISIIREIYLPSLEAVANIPIFTIFAFLPY